MRKLESGHKAGLFSGENSGYPWVGVLADLGKTPRHGRKENSGSQST
jgi:hypothetical protein